MIVDDLKSLLKEYDIFIPNENNYCDIYDLYQSNVFYATISNNYPVTMESVRKDVEEIPPITTRENKYYLTIYNQEDRLIAVLDFINGYEFKNPNNFISVWIGLLEVNNSYQGLGIGEKILNAFMETCFKNNITKIQLGVIKENNIAFSFWKKHGFHVIQEANNGEFDLYIMERLIKNF